MESIMLVTICFLVAFPLATGLQCYECTGISVNSGANTCVDGAASNPKKTCVDAVAPKVVTCVQVKYTAEAGGQDATNVQRSCGTATADDSNTCKMASQTIGGVSLEVNTCQCTGELCNGQTTLAPAIVTCLVSLLLAVYASC